MRAVVVCPGRGSYTKENLGSLKNPQGQMAEFLFDIDERRKAASEPTISELDGAEVFKPTLHTRGEHASALIYACAYADFLAIDRSKIDIVAVTGNSMGWYLALAFGGSLDWAGAFSVINGMGSMMKESIVGGQVIYPISDEQWHYNAKLQADVDQCLREAKETPGVEAHVSIHLGGYLVFGANKEGVQFLLKRLPKVGDYPFQLINHAAFHTPLLNETSAKAFAQLSGSLFQRPQIPLIDGRGHIWQPLSTDTDRLYEYTLGHQVVAPYDFTKAITVALKEFAPDALILLGPGSSLGGSIGQVLIANNWRNIDSKAAFSKMQSDSATPPLIAMGRPDQRSRVI